MKMVAIVIVLCMSKVFVWWISKMGKKGMYGVNKLNMDTHEYVVNLEVNVNYLNVKVKSEICCDIDHRK